MGRRKRKSLALHGEKRLSESHSGAKTPDWFHRKNISPAFLPPTEKVALDQKKANLWNSMQLLCILSKKKAFKTGVPVVLCVLFSFLQHFSHIYKFGKGTFEMSRYIKLLPSCICGLRHETELIFFDMSAWKDSINKILCYFFLFFFWDAPPSTQPNPRRRKIKA